MRYVLFASEGRINRTQFWFYGMLPMWLPQGVGAVMLYQAGVQLSLWVSFLVGLVLLYPSLAVCAKRSHDLNRQGSWILLLFIPIIGFLYFLVLGFWPGDEEDNWFGKVPTL